MTGMIRLYKSSTHIHTVSDGMPAQTPRQVWRARADWFSRQLTLPMSSGKHVLPTKVGGSKGEHKRERPTPWPYGSMISTGFTGVRARALLTFRTISMEPKANPFADLGIFCQFGCWLGKGPCKWSCTYLSACKCQTVTIWVAIKAHSRSPSSAL